MSSTKLRTLAHDALHRCFGCGDANKAGLRLKFFLDEEHQQVISPVRLARRFEGPPGYAHGGIIATLLDEAMSKANRQHGVTAMTRQMDVQYLRPVPLQQPLTIRGRRVSHEGRKSWCEAEIVDEENRPLARGKALFITVDRSTLMRFAKIDK